ncbi:MAG: ABC transporter permease [Chloroflexi bacterium]|nr:ABC transporter permease [Chloroflexota bacterium]
MRASILGLTRTLSIPALAVLTALLIGALIMLLSGGNPLVGYVALFEGAFGKARSLSETAVAATPYVFAGLGIALGFRGGLFNIGVEGQLFIGSICAAGVGYAVHGLPWFIHMPLALLAGCLGGAICAGIPGFLKAKTGAHEVITTIMINYMAIYFTNWLVTGPMQDPGTIVPQTRRILATAEIPAIWGAYRVHWGTVLAIAAAALVFWLLWRTVLGFEIRTVGANPDAAKYAGIHVGRNIVITMMLSGALAGAAGAVEVLGLNHYFAPSFSIGYGFDSIAVAVLGKSHPWGVVASAFLFGALNNGANLMQLRTQSPVYIISIVQALILMLVSADQIVRRLYRLKDLPKGNLATPAVATSESALGTGKEAKS